MQKFEETASKGVTGGRGGSLVVKDPRILDNKDSGFM